MDGEIDRLLMGSVLYKYAFPIFIVAINNIELKAKTLKLASKRTILNKIMTHIY